MVNYVYPTLYFAMWRTGDAWRDGVECKFQWVVTGDPSEFRDTIIDWAYESQQDNWEPRRWDYEHSPKRPETLRPALRWIEYMNDGCGGQFVWFKATAGRGGVRVDRRAPRTCVANELTD